MLDDANQQAEIFKRGQEKPDTAQSHDYFEDTHFTGENFVRSVQLRVYAMKSLDSLFGKVMPQRQYQLLGSYMDGFAAYVSQFAEGQSRIKAELAHVGNDVYRLVEERARASAKRTEQLRSHVDALRDKLSKAIQRISDERRAIMEEYRSRIVSDLAKVGSLETASEEMQVAILGVLQKVESDIVQREEETEKDIANKTDHLHQMMKGAASFERM
ncbi:MAG: hypothetical protein Q7R79_05235 [bacterium]|nr:hypothetical protein [bacterium]